MENEKTCPLCGSLVKQFYLNFNEEVTMCENSECEFPFGHEDLRITRACNPWDDESTLKSSRKSTASSTVSSVAWLEIDKMNRAYESEDSQFESQFEARPLDVKEYLNHKDGKPKVDKKDRQKELLNNVEEIGKLNMKLVKEDKLHIRNEIWIKKLLSLQGMTGVQLVKPEEAKQLKKEVTLGGSELKIDIDTNSSISSIRIELNEKATEP